jgi:hypothetical protein
LDESSLHPIANASTAAATVAAASMFAPLVFRVVRIFVLLGYGSTARQTDRLPDKPLA